MPVIEHKILPLKCARGHVPGHAWIAHEHCGSNAEYVVFETHSFLPDVHAPTRIEVHVCHLSAYMQQGWPKYGSVQSVILRNGQRVYAKQLSAIYPTNELYAQAPLVARGVHSIVGLCSGAPLLEVAGVRAYLNRLFYHPCEHKPELILDPWARDNAAFHAQHGTTPVPRT